MFEFKGVFTSTDPASLRLDSKRYPSHSLRPLCELNVIEILPKQDEAGDDQEELEQSVALLAQQGLPDFLAINYCTWGGPVEYFESMKVKDSKVLKSSIFKPNSDTTDDAIAAAFIQKMTAYGLPVKKSGYFAPFATLEWRRN